MTIADQSSTNIDTTYDYQLTYVICDQIYSFRKNRGGRISLYFIQRSINESPYNRVSIFFLLHYPEEIVDISHNVT